MNLFQTILLVLAVFATLYQAFKLLEIGMLISHYGTVIVKRQLWYMVAGCVAIQVAFILSLTGIDF